MCACLEENKAVKGSKLKHQRPAVSKDVEWVGNKKRRKERQANDVMND